MITNKGKTIIAKYLIGQVPAYASYLAVGCGQTPVLEGTNTNGLFAEKEQLEFEMFRVPIVSRGYVNDNGQEKIVLTAELPTQDRYEITEIGVYSAAANPSAISYDSRMLYSFSDTEGWELHTDTEVLSIDSKLGSLGDTTTPYDIIQTEKAFFTNADNKTLQNQARIDRYEIPRYLNNTLLLAGNLSNLGSDGSSITTVTGDHVHLTGVNLSFDKNSPQDEFRIAFSVLNREANSDLIPGSVRILIEATSADNVSAGSSSAFAKMEIIVEDISSTNPNSVKHDFTNNRYVVAKAKIDSLKTSPDFSWNQMNAIKVYASIIPDGGESPTNDFYLALDGIRLENLETVNPLYGMTGYSVIKTENALPITKYANTANLVEFRFSLGVS